MNKKLIKVEVADTPEKHMQGLMFRESLPEEDGMLFKFNAPSDLRFWGFNTYIPLSIAFISPENKIERISHIKPLSTKVVSSEKKCTMALEANPDFFVKRNIQIGDFIKIIKNDNDTYVEFEKQQLKI